VITLPEFYGPVYAMAVADFNADGLLDIAASIPNTPSIDLLVNEGSFRFRRVSPPALHTQSFRLVPADLNGDGNTDLVSFNSWSSTTVTVYINDGTTWREGPVFPWSWGGMFIAAADVDGNETMDLVVSAGALSATGVLLNFDTTACMLSLGSITFGDVLVGGSQTRSAVLWHAGDEPIIIDSLAMGGSSFSCSLTTPFVGRRDSLEIPVAFHPRSVGSASDSLRLWIRGTHPRTITLSGNGTTTAGIARLDVPVPMEFGLSQNYPNPFNPSTTIQFGVPEQSHVTISVFTVLGQKVGDLADTQLSAGYYTIHWTPQVASGMYICTMSATGVNPGSGSFRGQKRMLLLR
jgi:hypothetical protein